MNLTIDDFSNDNLIYRGQVRKRFSFDGKDIFKIDNGTFYRKTDWNFIPPMGFFPNIQIHNIRGVLILIYVDSRQYYQVEQVKVIESETANPFDGFEPNKIYELKNGQKWKQFGGPNAPNHHSTGHVIIIDEKLKVDDWDFYPNVSKVFN